MKVISIKCITECRKCITKCQACSNCSNCSKTNVKMKEVLKYCKCCIILCNTVCEMLKFDENCDMTKRLCMLCASCCIKCSSQCLKFKDDKKCKDCSIACKICATACKKCGASKKSASKKGGGNTNNPTIGTLAKKGFNTTLRTAMTGFEVVNSVVGHTGNVINTTGHAIGEGAKTVDSAMGIVASATRATEQELAGATTKRGNRLDQSIIYGKEQALQNRFTKTNQLHSNTNSKQRQIKLNKGQREINNKLRQLNMNEETKRIDIEIKAAQTVSEELHARLQSTAVNKHLRTQYTSMLNEIKDNTLNNIESAITRSSVNRFGKKKEQNLRERIRLYTLLTLKNIFEIINNIRNRQNNNNKVSFESNIEVIMKRFRDNMENLVYQAQSTNHKNGSLSGLLESLESFE
jgi:hypothetical protein